MLAPALERRREKEKKRKKERRKGVPLLSRQYLHRPNTLGKKEKKKRGKKGKGGKKGEKRTLYPFPSSFS